MLGLPALDGLLADALPADGQARHVIGRIDRKEQDERKEIDAQQDQYPVQQAADDVGGHGRGSPDGAGGTAPGAAPKAVWRSRRLSATYDGQIARPSTSASRPSGHHTGVFHS